MKILRSLLFTPGNNLRMIFKLTYGIYPDAVILDLEDSVPPREKHTARIFVRDSIPKLSSFGHKVFVRINEDEYHEDLHYVIVDGLEGIVIPKCETANQIRNIEKTVIDLEKERKIKQQIRYILLIETPRGLVNVTDILRSSERVDGIAFGAEDFALEMGIPEPTSELISLPRTLISITAHAFDITPIDKVYPIINDLKGLREEAIQALNLGYVGKLVIHPRQIKVVNEVFTPKEDEYKKALKIINEYEEAMEKGIGAINVDGQLVDKPVYMRAKKIFEKMEAIHKLDERWRDL